MRLPIKTLQQIIGHPVARFSGSGHKRAIGRIQIKTNATVYPLRDDLLDDPFSVSVNDISAETVGLTSTRAVMPFSTIVLNIPLPAGEDETDVAVRCKIVRCTRQRDGLFRVAAQFQGLCQLQHMLSQAR